MTTVRTKQLLGLALAPLLFGVSNTVQAGAVIFDTGNEATASVALGVNDEGHLNFSAPGFSTDNAGPTGLAFKFPDGTWQDATSPGCLCEGWGVAVTTNDGTRVSAFANEASGSGGIAGGTFGATPNTATSVVSMLDADVTITHAYGPSLQAGIFQGNVTVTNNTGSTIQDLVYRRVMDWDIPPTEFDEYVTHGGVEANLESVGGNVRFAGDDGFYSSDPLDVPDPTAGSGNGYIREGTQNVDFEDSGADDHGSLFDFAFGDLANGESRSFNIFYGARASETEALAAISALGANVYSLGQSNPNPGDGGEGGGDFDEGAGFDGEFAVATAATDGPGNPDGTPVTFIFAFGGVGGVAPGSDPSNPILPFVPAEDTFEFPAPVPNQWFDPPFVDGFRIALSGGGEFTEVTLGPDFDNLEIVVDGIVVNDDFDNGELFVFASGVSEFVIRGINPDIDAGAVDLARAFPLLLNFTGSPSLMTWTALDGAGATVPLPGPGTWGLLLSSIIAISVFRRRRSHA